MHLSIYIVFVVVFISSFWIDDLDIFYLQYVMMSWFKCRNGCPPKRNDRVFAINAPVSLYFCLWLNTFHRFYDPRFYVRFHWSHQPFGCKLVLGYGVFYVLIVQVLFVSPLFHWHQFDTYQHDLRLLGHWRLVCTAVQLLCRQELDQPSKPAKKQQSGLTFN